MPRGSCIARHTTAYLHIPASNALTACCTEPPIFTVPIWICQVRFGNFNHRAVDGHDGAGAPRNYRHACHCRRS